MSGKLVIIYPDGTRTEEPYSGDEPPLETLQGHVKGYIEVVPGMVKFDEGLRVAYINEEGLLEDLPVNPYASRIANMRIVGNMVVIIPTPEAKPHA
jgi:Domain of unknown function (DUF3846)